MVSLDNKRGGRVKVYKGQPETGGIRQKLYKELEFITKIIASRQVTSSATDSGEYYEPPYDPSDLSKLLEIDITHYRCTMAKASDSAGIGYRVVKPDGTAADEEEEVKIRKFISSINPRMSLIELLSAFVVDREAVGWGVLEVIRDRGGRVVRLEHVPAKSVRVLREPRDPRGAKFVQLVGTGEERVYFQEFPDKYEGMEPLYVDANTGEVGSTREKATNELIFWRKVHPSTRFYGMPDIIPALGDILAAREVRDYFIEFFENNCVPRLAIVVKGGEMSEATKTELVTFLRSEVKSSPHRTIVMEIDEDVTIDFERLDHEQNEQDFRETRKDLRDFVLLAHGIPPAQVGVIEAANLGSGSGLSQAETYLNRVVIPIQAKLHTILDRILESGVGVEGTVIRLIAPDIRDLQAQVEALTKYVERGIYSINEARTELGKRPIPGGEKHYVWSRSTTPRIISEEGATELESETTDQKKVPMKPVEEENVKVDAV